MRKYIIATILIWLITFVVFYTDLNGISSEFTLFGRAGSILTLCGVVLEYQISMTGQRKDSYDTKSSISMSDLGGVVFLSAEEKYVRSFAHLTVVLGTFIWGFGDLVTKL